MILTLFSRVVRGKKFLFFRLKVLFFKAKIKGSLNICKRKKKLGQTKVELKVGKVNG